MRTHCLERMLLVLLLASFLACSADEETLAPAASSREAPDPGESRQVPPRDFEGSGSVVADDPPAAQSEEETGPGEPGELSVVLFEAVDTNDPEDLMDAIAALEDLGGQTAIDTLGMVLQRSQDPDAKIQSIDALAFLAEEGDISAHMQHALLDESAIVRAEAADVVAELLLLDLLPDLRIAEARESDPGVREVLEDAIYEIEIEYPSETDEMQ